MAQNVELKYCSDSKDFSFALNLNSATHRQRLLTTVSWAARNGVDVIIIAAPTSATPTPFKANGKPSESTPSNS